jgi:hypothetical protein
MIRGAAGDSLDLRCGEVALASCIGPAVADDAGPIHASAPSARATSPAASGEAGRQLTGRSSALAIALATVWQSTRGSPVSSIVRARFTRVAAPQPERVGETSPISPCNVECLGTRRVGLGSTGGKRSARGRRALIFGHDGGPRAERYRRGCSTRSRVQSFLAGHRLQAQAPCSSSTVAHGSPSDLASRTASCARGTSGSRARRCRTHALGGAARAGRPACDRESESRAQRARSNVTSSTS